MDRKIQKIFLISILVVVAIALIDIFALRSQLFGNYEQYTSGFFSVCWWFLFRNIVVLIMALVSMVYYILLKDKSEAIAVGIGSYVLWLFGFADILYFFFQGKEIPLILANLNGHPIIGRISANILKQPIVTSTALYLSTILGFIVSFFTIKILRKKF